MKIQEQEIAEVLVYLGITQTIRDLLAWHGVNQTPHCCWIYTSKSFPLGIPKTSSHKFAQPC